MAYTNEQRRILRKFGRRVRDARNDHGWTQEDLADEAGLNRTYVGGIERGERNLALLNVNKLALALNENFDGFLPCHAGQRRTR